MKNDIQHYPAGLARRTLCAVLAVLSSGTAISLAAYVGWQRGAVAPERVLWIMLAVIAVLACHLLPALTRGLSWRLRLAAALVWLVASLVTLYGHASFVLLAQAHVGQAQAERMAIPALPTDDARRELVSVAREIATVQARLAYARKAADRHALSARLDALNVEMSQARRTQANYDAALTERERAIARREAARGNPVTGAVATWLSLSPARVNLIVALACAVALEGVALIAWLLVLPAPEASRQPLGRLLAQSSVAANAAETEPVSTRLTPRKPLPHPEQAPAPASRQPRRVSTADAGQLAQLDLPFAASAAPESSLESRIRRAIAQGVLRGTVADIGRHLGCSHTNALRVRRNLLKLGTLA